MTTKELTEQWFAALWTRRDAKAIYDLMASDASGVTEAGEVHGPKEFEEKVFRPFLQAFPDLKVTLDGMTCDGDEAAIRWTARGAHTGPMGSVPPSNRKIAFSGMTWIRFKNGKVVEGCDRFNLHAVLAYLSQGTTSASVRSDASAA